MHGNLNLDHFAKIEAKVLEDKGFPTFFAMGHGHFLDFLLRTEEIKQVIYKCQPMACSWLLVLQIGMGANTLHGSLGDWVTKHNSFIYSWVQILFSFLL